MGDHSVGVIDAPTASQAVRRFYCRVAARPVWILLVGLITVTLASSELNLAVPVWIQYIPLLSSVVILGLPHGAVDHLAPARTAGLQVTYRGLIAIGLLYTIFGGVYGILWSFYPETSAVMFIALTWFHWGQGDLYALALLGAQYLDSRLRRVATVVIRGGLPMLVPLLAFPDDYRTIVSAWVALFGSNFELMWLFSAPVRAGLGIVFSLLILVTMVSDYWSASEAASGTRTAWNGKVSQTADEKLDIHPVDVWWIDVGETVLLYVYFLVVPPLIAVGVYFCFWHSLRHIIRLLAVDTGAQAALVRGDTVQVLIRFGREAAPLTILSFGLLSVVVILVPVTLTSTLELISMYLVFISILTLPHVIVVLFMDVSQGLWSKAADETDIPGGV
ncbi:Brp/Blh family beta-carotene 15,15'-dioxygenase [Halocatena marina]|uniref:Brp/Blh family beta-carotene 15,15'-dioxygenase n=1 Tax=Halocatena marina TaxID=2934937 RepID=UPI002224A1FA|nr:Brp/Blh family beta-carotene 15,15'-dioxygenase [Halocatena marina]